MISVTRKLNLLIVALASMTAAQAESITIEPTIWYEITSEAGTTLTVEPDSLRVGTASFQARAFWEFSLEQVLAEFESITFAELTLTNVGRTHNIQLNTYQADADPTLDDFFNNNLSDIFLDAPLYGFDDPFERGPENIFDVTAGIEIALAGSYDFVGIMVWAPSPGGVPNTFSEILADISLIVTGTPVSVPEPGILALFLIGLAGVGLAKRRNPAA